MDTSKQPPKRKTLSVSCPHCKSHFKVLSSKELPSFCISCGHSLNNEESQISQGSDSDVTLVSGHTPQAIQFSLGPYQVINSIGKGGMGEVFLAYDTMCGRRIALKRIRPDLLTFGQIQNRFLKEARVTCQLTHPAIIPIYSIHKEENLAYYTMPFVEGETLKQILRKTRQQEKKGEKLDHIGGSIPALIRVFIAICQAVAYAHAKGVLHRDLKPENIIIGKYGEVMILDWGLAKLFHEEEEHNKPPFDEENLKESASLHYLTRLGKVVGTLSYMAPERAMGQSATVQTDIYSLGVILYQILTLRLPFKRRSLKEYRETLAEEIIQDPIEIAPYRDVPKILASIAIKCLSPTPLQRYFSVDELIRELENYIEGRTEWFKIAELSVHNKTDWEFQEHILIAEHTAITRNTEISEWVSLMISKASFAENLCLSADVYLGESCQGIGFLLNVPEASERENVNDGYCVWLGSDINKTTKVLKSSHEVLHAEEVFLPRKEWLQIRIEKVENTIHFYLNDIFQFSFINRMPIVGTHVGLLSRDVDFELKDFFVFVGSQNIMVNCLAVPDAFLAHKDYLKALSEYRRIGYAFPGRAEGREAILRSGITLIEQAKSEGDPKLFDAALNEFELLHKTAGAPLEYLGKALVYQAMQDNDEEIKCFELACRRYAQHPLLHVLEEQAIFRMQESSRIDRKATYSFLLLTLRFIHRFQSSQPVQKLISSLKKHWEELPFILKDSASRKPNISLAIPLAFWLNKNYILEEIIDELAACEPLPIISLSNALFALKKLDQEDAALNKLKEIKEKAPNAPSFGLIEVLLSAQSDNLDDSLEKLSLAEGLDEDKLRTLEFLLDLALDTQQTALVHKALNSIKEALPSPLIHRDIWAYLLEKNWQAAGTLLHTFPFELLCKESSLLYFLYGCWLYVTEGQEIANMHFSGVLDAPYPRTYALASHYLAGKVELNWFNKAFIWEKKQLERQLKLFRSLAE